MFNSCALLSVCQALCDPTCPQQLFRRCGCAPVHGRAVCKVIFIAAFLSDFGLVLSSSLLTSPVRRCVLERQKFMACCRRLVCLGLGFFVVGLVWGCFFSFVYFCCFVV